MSSIRKPLTVASSSAKAKQSARSKKSTDRGNTLTHERLEEQMRAFRKAGGKIEVLGTTHSLRNISPSNEQKAGLPQPVAIKSASRR